MGDVKTLNGVIVEVPRESMFATTMRSSSGVKHSTSSSVRQSVNRHVRLEVSPTMDHEVGG